MNPQEQTDFLKFLSDSAAAMLNYQHLTQDKRYGSRALNGKVQLVRVEYDANGKSTVTPCSRWIKTKNWLKFMRSVSV